MADYIYLLEHRLSHAQQNAIGALRTIAREHDATIFLTGGAVRDLTVGTSVRDLDLTIQGDLSKMKKSLAAAGFETVGENRDAQLLFLTYTGGVRVELGSAVSVSWPKPGKPKYDSGSLIDDLRSRDFTANAMAISLNGGSYGLLMDPLNGIADIENRELRLVSNYGFIEDPSRLFRAVRFMSRLGWQMEEKTRGRYETAKEEGYASALNGWNRGYELEEIFHEEDPVRVLRALEHEGWMQHLYPAFQSAKSNTAALNELFNRQGELQVQGIVGQVAAIAFPLVTGKMSAGDVAGLKALFPRPGFVREVESLEARTKEFGAKFGGKEAALPSAAWKLLHSSEPNLVLSLAYGNKNASVKSRLETFLKDSPTARQRIPYQLLTEMRITPDLPEYNPLLETLFYELMDNRLSTPEDLKAFLEPYSPPAPPPPPNLRRARARKEAKGGRGKKKVVEVEETFDGEDTPLSVAAEEEADGLETGLTETGDLTGPDRGTEPTEEKPIKSVAPTVVKVAVKKQVKPLPAQAAAAKPVVEAPAKQATAPIKPATPVAKKTVPTAKVAPVKVAPVKAVPAKASPVRAVAVKSAPVKAASAKSAGGKAAANKGPVKTAGHASQSKRVPLKSVKAAPAKPAKKAAPIKPAAKKPVPTKKSTGAKIVPKVVPAKKAVVKKAPAKTAKAVARKPVPVKKAPAKAVKKAAAKKSSRR